MSLEYFAKKVALSETEKVPAWVSSDNKSLEAYRAVSFLRATKLDFIKSHSRKSEFRRKSDWQISGAELARSIDAKLPTIMHNTTYSEFLKTHLAAVNDELAELLTKRLDRIRQRRSRGPIMRNKDELVDEVRALRAQVEKLNKLNAEDQVQSVVGMLTLPIRKKLGL